MNESLSRFLKEMHIAFLMSIQNERIIMAATHAISDGFNTALLKGGVLHPLLEAIRDDETLMLGLRGKYVSIYYRGGQLLKIELDHRSNSYGVTFDRNYYSDAKLAERLQRRGVDMAVLDGRINSVSDSGAIVDMFGELKGLMDLHSKIRSGHEREYQQLVARENNRSRSAGASHYFITDMEHASGDARFDMLGARWRHDERKHGDRLVPVLFEMKYGEDALEGKSGLVAHLRDIFSRLEDEAFRATLKANVGAHFNQLYGLGLLEFNRSSAINRFDTVENYVQIVFVLASYNPRSTRLKRILGEVKALMQERKDALDRTGVTVDLRFFHASFCGYAMHDDTMLTVDQMCSLMESWGSAEQDGASGALGSQ